MLASVQRIIAEGHHLKGCLITTFTFPVTSMVVSSLQAALKWSARIGGIRYHSPSTVDQPACLLLCLLCTPIVTQSASLIQAEQSVQVAAEQASQNQVQALTAKMQQTEKGAKRLQATIGCIMQPIPVQF